MRVYLFQIAKLFLLFYAIFLMDCSDSEFCNPLDPVPGDCKLRLIDNFDDGKDPNLLGYNPEFFYDKKKIETHYESNRQIVLNGKGFSLRIQFDVNDSGSFQGWIQVLGEAPGRGFDVSKFKYLSFWIKTDPESVNCEISLKDTKEEPIGKFIHETDPKFLLSEIKDFKSSKEWKKISIPLSDLIPVYQKNPVDLKCLYQLIFGFGNITLNNLDPPGVLKGTIYIDDIAFEK